MAVFVELDDDDVELPQQGGKPLWEGILPSRHGLGSKETDSEALREEEQNREDHDAPIEESNRGAVAEALGCYPIAMAVAAHLDLNTLDNLSRTCRSIRYGLLQYRKMLVISTLHCSNEDLPVDQDNVLRYRARAANWFYMQEELSSTRTGYMGKTGQCARDMVSDCRRCGTVVCRNCAIKPPAPIVLRDRHRRLCNKCTRAPLGSLVRPKLPAETTLDSEEMQRAVCKCESAEGVWLCQPCGRTIRHDDLEYKTIWRWRTQYGEVLGGIGTGIAEGDRGVVCGRDASCLAATNRETETDCDAEDLREASIAGSSTSDTGSSPPHTSSNYSSTSIGGGRTSSPALGPGYARHEIEGIGGVVKRKLVRMVKVGACVPEYEDEKTRNDIMGREVSGKVRSWCGWCWRVVPGIKDHDAAKVHGRDSVR